MESICKLKDIYKALYEFEAAFHEQFGITLNEGIVICMLSKGPMKAGDICAECSLSTSRLSKVLGALEQKGLIVRTMGKNDRRTIYVELTQAGVEKKSVMSPEKVCIPESLSKMLK